ncbi:MAG: hypothetical protein N2423_10410, partial [Novosphingobium sp.]|nr:hypothetical protein [Novosphingobium sp.]
LIALLIYATLWNSPVPLETRRESNRTIRAIAEAIIRHDGGGGFLNYDAPPYLYALTGKPFLSPLIFPHHLNHAIERNVSHLRTDEEIDRVLAAGPGVIVMSRFPRNFPVNTHTRARVIAYAHAHCRTATEMPLREGPNTFAMMVFGDCLLRR